MEYWKKQLKEYTTSSAFRLELSRPQLKVMCYISEVEKLTDDGCVVIGRDSHNYSTMTALERKGMIHHDGDLYRITGAGKLGVFVWSVLEGTLIPGGCHVRSSETRHDEENLEKEGEKE